MWREKLNLCSQQFPVKTSLMYISFMRKKVLVTAGSRGLGAAICHELAISGSQIVVASRKSNSLDQLMASLSGTGHEKVEIDFQNRVEKLNFLNQIESFDFDIVVNNLGGNLRQTSPLDTYDSYSRVMDFNLGIAIDINSKVIPRMIEKGWGRITHISSISALENQGPPQYCAAKAALNAYIRSVGRFVASEGIVITGVMPGAVLTSGGYWDEVLQERPDHARKFLTERMAIKRFGKPEEISALVAFLVSDDSSFMTGSIVLADGGQGRSFQ